MHKINKVSDLHSLPLPQSALQELQQNLLQPFSDEEEADSLWAELNCQLWLIENLDQIPDDVDDKDLLIFALENPELEDTIGDKYWLLLSILSQDGQGLFILAESVLKESLYRELGVNYD